MNKDIEYHVDKFLDHIKENYDLVSLLVDNETNPYTLRNVAASLGVEMTPQEVKDSMELIKIAVEILREEHE